MKYNKEYSNKEIIKIICESAQRYKENLLNKNIMFIFERKKNQNISVIQTVFLKSNFLHLTGIKYYKSANKFFEECIDNEISSDNVIIKNKIFTQSKLQVLENAMSISKSAKRIGEFNQSKVNIKIEKVIGNTHYCIGFSNLDSNNKKLKYYYPKTLIQDNLKNNITDDNRVIVILSKNKNQKLYNHITYLSKNVNLEILKEKDYFKSLIDFKSIYSDNLKYQEKIDEFLSNQNKF